MPVRMYYVTLEKHNNNDLKQVLIESSSKEGTQTKQVQWTGRYPPVQFELSISLDPSFV